MQVMIVQIAEFTGTIAGPMTAAHGTVMGTDSRSLSGHGNPKSLRPRYSYRSATEG